MVDTDTPIRYGTARGRWVILATVLGSSMALLDSTVVGIALPVIGREFDAGMDGLQWAVNGYTLTLAGFLLQAGALADRLGRKRIFLIGVVWFAVASLLCAVAWNVEALIAARALQGVGAALLTPGSLAILQASFAPGDRAKAIGAWSGLGGVAAAAGPFVGGYLVDQVSWRWIFLLNLPLAARDRLRGRAARAGDARSGRGTQAGGRHGRVAGAVGLAGLTYGLIEGPSMGWDAPLVLACLVGGIGMLVVVRAGGAAHPGSAAADGGLQVPAVQHGEPRHADDLRRVERCAVPAADRAPAGGRLLPDPGRHRAAAVHRPDAHPVRADGRAGEPDRAAAADDGRAAGGRRRAGDCWRGSTPAATTSPRCCPRCWSSASA